MSSNMLKKLRLGHDSKGAVTAFQTADGRLQTMPAIYSESLLKRIRKRLMLKNNALYPLLNCKNRKVILVKKSSAFENFNDPKTWKQLLKSIH